MGWPHLALGCSKLGVALGLGLSFLGTVTQACSPGNRTGANRHSALGASAQDLPSESPLAEADHMAKPQISWVGAVSTHSGWGAERMFVE
jgi:hypothetical protein